MAQSVAGCVRIFETSPARDAAPAIVTRFYPAIIFGVVFVLHGGRPSIDAAGCACGGTDIAGAYPVNFGLPFTHSSEPFDGGKGGDSRIHPFREFLFSDSVDVVDRVAP